MARKLRIAVSIFFGLLTVALCVLWVRSYWQRDVIRYFPANVAILIELQSNNGYLRYLSHVVRESLPESYWVRISSEQAEFTQGRWYESDEVATFVHVPHSLPVAIAVVLTALSIVSYRFSSTQTLLIATPLLAVALGLGIWLAR